MTVYNEFAQYILESKYYADKEYTPEELFNRVARVCSIPDVLDCVITNDFYPKGLRDKFAPYEDICDRALARRTHTVSEDSNDTGTWEDVKGDLISDIWRQAATKYYNAMCSMEFMPATPTLINAGNNVGMLSSCFFLRVPDSMEGIFDTVKNVAIISKAGGGVGLDISELRPAGAPVSNTNGKSSGPISFLKVFNETGNQVQQGGIRRAALIGILSIDHPDVISFIKCKEKEGELSNFNMSVLITDTFMRMLDQDPNQLWVCRFGKDEYLISKEDDKSHVWNGKVPERDARDRYYTVKDIWELLVYKAWSNGEPGCIFYDTLNSADVFKGKYGKLGVNPCGELPLLNYESCNLAAINLRDCWTSDKPGRFEIDIEKIKKVTRLGIQFLDNCIDVNNFPLPEIEEWTTKTRRVGLGTMGLHDLMLRLGVKYGSDESITLIDTVYSVINAEAHAVSEELGKLRGIPPALKEAKLGRRNSGLLTVQPTGTISMICNQTSSGVEPVFQWEYTRKDSYGTHLMRHFMVDEVRDTEYQPDYMISALEVPPSDHVKIQAAVQKYIDSSISKTCNFPNDATVEDVDRVYRMAYNEKCKSITVYRSGSRNEEVLIANTQKVVDPQPVRLQLDIPTDTPQAAIIQETRERPPVLFGATFKINTPGGKAYITVNEDDRGIREVFIHISKAGSEITTHVETEGRLISHALKAGIPAEDIVRHLAGHKSNPIFDRGRSIKSVPDAVAVVLQEYMNNYLGFSEFIENCAEKAVHTTTTATSELSGELCPDCGELLYMLNGCNSCQSCGYSKCG
jgi:ribonucleoside-diphosphate reductase alpha chain